MGGRIAKGLLSLAAGLVSAHVVCAQGAMPAKAREALNAGLAAAQSQQWTVALQDFQKALNLAPATPQIMFDLGLVNDKMGGHALAALAWYRAYLAVSPAATNRAPVAARAKALAAQVKASSKALIAKALVVDAQLPPNIRLSGLEQIAGADATTGNSAAALALIANAPLAVLDTATWPQTPQQLEESAKESRDGAYEQLASTLATANDLAGANEAVRRITGANPYEHDRSGAKQNISMSLANAGQFAKAAFYAAQLDGLYREAAFKWVADVQFQKGDKAGAKASIDKALAAFDRINCKQYDCVSIGASLIGSVQSIEGLAAARRLFVKIGRIPHPNAYSINSARQNFVAALAAAGRFEEAKRLAARITGTAKIYSPRWGAQQAITNALQSKTQNALNALTPQLNNARTLDQVHDVEAALTKLPPTAQTWSLYLQMASSYRVFSDVADSNRVLNALNRAAARMKPSADRAGFQIDLARNYVLAGQNEQATRLIARLVLAPFLPGLVRQQYPFQAQNLANGLAGLAVLQAKSRDLRAARISALKALAIARNLKQNYYALDEVCSVAPALSLVTQCQDFAEKMPPGANRDEVYAGLVGGYRQSIDPPRPISKAAFNKIKELSTRIANSTTRINALSPFMSAFAATQDWRDARALAGDAPSLVEDLAVQMLAAGRIDDAKALEPLFAGDRQQLANYEVNLAQHLADSGQIAAAIAAVKGLPDAGSRIVPFYQVAKTAFDWGGPGVRLAASAANAGFADFYALPKFTCWALAQIVPSSEPAWNRPNRSMALKKCLAQRADWTLVNTQWSCCRSAPDMPGALRNAYQEWRFWLDRDVLAREQSSNVSNRQAADRGEVYTLYGDGAIELANSQFTTHPNMLTTDAVQRLAEDDPLDARVLAGRLAARARAQTPGYARDQAMATAAEAFVAIGDLTAASALMSDIVGRDAYLSALRYVSVLAQKEGSGQAPALLAQEAQLDRVTNENYYLDGLLKRAAELGLHPLAENSLARYSKIYPDSWCSTSANYVSGLLRHADSARAVGELKADLPRLAALAPVDRLACAKKLANLLAWAGQKDALEDVLKSAPDAAFLASALRSAAHGYARAGDTVAARAALQRALAALKIVRPDFEGWSAALIAEAQGAVDPEGADKAALAIADPEWRARAIAGLATRRLAASDLQGAASILENSAPMRDPVLDQALARAARWLFGQGQDKPGRALIRRIDARTLREATWHFCILSRARFQPAADPFKNVDSVKTFAEKAYLLIDLSALLHSQGRDDLGQKALGMAQSLIPQIKDPLVQADVAAWVARASSWLHASSTKAAYAAAAAVAGGIADPSARADMQALAGANLDLSTPVAPGSAAQLKAAESALAKRVGTEAGQFVAGLNYQTDLGDTGAYTRSLVGKPANQVVGLLTQAAIDRSVSLAKLDGLVKGWKQPTAGAPGKI